MTYPNNAAERDFVPSAGPDRSYLIASTPRTGSTLLCEALWLTGVAGAPHEYFNRVHERELAQRFDAPTYDGYFAALLQHRTGPNGVFGLNLHFDQMAHLADNLARRAVPGMPRRPMSDDDLLNRASMLNLSSVLPRLRVIWLRRRDHLRQAISWYRAHHTGRWGAEEQSAREPPYRAWAIERFMGFIEQHERGWQELFRQWHVTPMAVYYEDFTRAPLPCLTSVLQHLELPVPSPLDLPARAPQADAITRAWVERYQQEQGTRSGHVA